MPKHLILVAGNIGSGKTSLTERIGERLGWRTAYESVADNPYLPDFYKDMKTWSFHLQVFFLGHRAKQHQEMAADPVKMYLNDIFTVTVNMAGLPGIAVPAGLDSNGLPLGLQLIGKPFDEETLFRAGHVIEQAAGRFQPDPWW